MHSNVCLNHIETGKISSDSFTTVGNEKPNITGNFDWTIISKTKPQKNMLWIQTYCYTEICVKLLLEKLAIFCQTPSIIVSKYI